MIIKIQNLVNKLLVLSFLLYLFQGIGFLFQAAIFGDVFLGPKEIKVILFLFLILVFLLQYNLKSKMSLFDIIILYIYFLFLTFNLLTINYYDSGEQSFYAFLYNYSLSIILIPLALLYSNNNDGRGGYFVTRFHKRLWLVLIFFISFIAIFEWYIQASIYAYFYDFFHGKDIIKFDHIHGSIRILSIFKSPIDYSYLNAIFASLCLILFLTERKAIYAVLFLLMTVIGFLIKVRTGMVFMLASYFVIFIYFFSWTRILKFFVPLIIVITFLIPFLDLNVILDPTNLFIRFENWVTLLDSLDSPTKILWGFGIVQNGSFGEYHRIVIDNLYIGMLLTGGVFSMLLFFFVISILVIRSMRKESLKKNVWVLSIVIGMLAAGLFENIMHLFYLCLIPIFSRFSDVNSPLCQDPCPLSNLSIQTKAGGGK